MKFLPETLCQLKYSGSSLVGIIVVGSVGTGMYSEAGMWIDKDNPMIMKMMYILLKFKKIITKISIFCNYIIIMYHSSNTKS